MKNESGRRQSLIDCPLTAECVPPYKRRETKYTRCKHLSGDITHGRAALSFIPRQVVFNMSSLMCPATLIRAHFYIFFFYICNPRFLRINSFAGQSRKASVNTYAIKRRGCFHRGGEYSGNLTQRREFWRRAGISFARLVLSPLVISILFQDKCNGGSEVSPLHVINSRERVLFHSARNA